MHQLKEMYNCKQFMERMFNISKSSLAPQGLL